MRDKGTGLGKQKKACSNTGMEHEDESRDVWMSGEGRGLQECACIGHFSSWVLS